jgi:hypothetical protein
MNKKWKMPQWMKAYAPLFVNTGIGATVENIEQMMNSNTNPIVNLPVSTLEACVKSQVAFLHQLQSAGALSGKIHS